MSKLVESASGVHDIEDRMRGTVRWWAMYECGHTAVPGIIKVSPHRDEAKYCVSNK